MQIVTAPAAEPTLEPLPARLGSRLRAARRVAVFALLTVALCPVQQVLVWLNAGAARRLPHLFHAAMARSLGLRIQVRGQRSADRPTLFVANHSSYLDINILSAVLPEVYFVAKAEVASYPVFGYLAKLQRTIFVDRKVRSTREQRDEMVSRLQAGDSLVLFAEGTSNDGNRVLPFKSALFSAAEVTVPSSVDGTTPALAPRTPTVQPVSIAFTRLDGMPLGRALRPYFAWYGDMELASHIFEMAGLGRVTIVVEFHAPVTIAAFGSRKALAEHCHREVTGGLANALTGRLHEEASLAGRFDDDDEDGAASRSGGQDGDGAGHEETAPEDLGPALPVAR